MENEIYIPSNLTKRCNDDKEFEFEKIQGDWSTDDEQVGREPAPVVPCSSPRGEGRSSREIEREVERERKRERDIYVSSPWREESSFWKKMETERGGAKDNGGGFLKRKGSGSYLGQLLGILGLLADERHEIRQGVVTVLGVLDHPRGGRVLRLVVGEAGHGLTGATGQSFVGRVQS